MNLENIKELMSELGVVVGERRDAGVDTWHAQWGELSGVVSKGNYLVVFSACGYMESLIMIWPAERVPRLYPRAATVSLCGGKYVAIIGLGKLLEHGDGDMLHPIG